MTAIQPGDIVRCVETWTTGFIESGDEYSVEDVRHRVAYPEVLILCEWVPARYFEPIAQAPKHELLLGRLGNLADEWTAMGRDLLLLTESHACERDDCARYHERGVSYIAQASTLRRIVEEESNE